MYILHLDFVKRKEIMGIPLEFRFRSFTGACIGVGQLGVGLATIDTGS